MSGLLLAAAGAGVAGTILHGVLWPRAQLFGRILHRGAPGCGPRVALSFDDGPHPGATRRILEVLESHRVPAAFFVIGRHAARAPNLLRELDRRGHLIGNHTYDHHHGGALRGRRYWQAQLQRTVAVVEQATGRRPRLFRPPMGLKQPHLMRAARGEGCTVVTWSRRALDGLPTTSARILARLGDCGRPGEILLLHDGVEPHARRTPEATVAALGPLIERLRARGLEPVRLDELLGEEAYG